MNDQFFGGLRQYIFAGSNYVYTYFYHQREMSFFFSWNSSIADVEFNYYRFVCFFLKWE